MLAKWICMLIGSGTVQVPLVMLLLHGPEDLSFDPGPDSDAEHSRDMRTAPDLPLCNAYDPSTCSLASAGAHGSHAAPAPAAVERCSRARSTGRAGKPAQSTAAQRRHPEKRRPRRCRNALLFMSWFGAWSTVFVVLADVSLRQHSEHYCGGWLQRSRLVHGAECPARPLAEAGGGLGTDNDFWSGASARHWAVETYGFALQA